jgi:hypothetical protein
MNRNTWGKPQVSYQRLTGTLVRSLCPDCYQVPLPVLEWPTAVTLVGDGRNSMMRGGIGKSLIGEGYGKSLIGKGDGKSSMGKGNGRLMGKGKGIHLAHEDPLYARG